MGLNVRWVALLLLLLIVLVTGMAAGSSGPGRIAFRSGDLFGNYSIFVMNADGSGRTRLTNDPAENQYSLAWSSDGTKIAFVSYQEKYVPEHLMVNGFTDLNVMNADGSGRTRHAINEYPLEISSYELAWSPDLTKIAAPSYIAGTSIVGILVMNADGSGLTWPVNTYWAWSPEWSPDGSKIVFSSSYYYGYDVNHNIQVMNADGSGRTRLTNDPAEDMFPRWSPDGTKIAYDSWHDGYYKLSVVNADGSGLTRLTNMVSESEWWTYPDWSPDGTKIAFVSWSDSNFDISVVNADGSGQTRLTNDPAGDTLPRWSPDGTKIAFVSYRDGNAEIYVVNADGSGQTRLTTNTVSDTEPVWEPDLVTANFTANITTGIAPLPVQFNDTSERVSPTNWSWDFGDGNRTSGTGFSSAKPVHVYRFPGSFTVRLTITNESGSSTTVKAGYIRVIGEPFSFDGPEITGISISPDNATTKKQITFEAAITQKPGYEVTGYHWILDNTATGFPEWAEDSNRNPTTYMPGAGKYGNRRITCTIMYREEETGQIGFDVFSKPFKVFFDKGTYPNWADDDHNGIPNWFEYWKRDRTIAGIESFSYTTYPEAGEYNPNNDTLFLGPDAPKTWMAFTLNTPRGAEHFGGLAGINNTAASILHESNHKLITHQWMPGGQFNGKTDSDQGLNNPDDNDNLPDFYENNVSLTSNNSTDTFNLSRVLAAGYSTYGDNEYMCYRAEGGYWAAISQGKDWSNPGLQTTVTGTGAGAMGVSSLMGILSGPSYGTTGYGVLSVGNDSDYATDTNGNTLYEVLTVTTNVTVSRTGTYAIEGILSDSAGGFITRAVREYELGEGTSQVSVDFPGTDIFHHGVDGPYNVSIRVYEASRESFVIDDRPDAWQTAAYPYTSFEGAQAWFSGSYSDAGTDVNGDGAYKYLTVTVGVNDSFWSPYQVEGYLDTGNGSALVYARTDGISFNGETQVMLQFDGRPIGLSGQNGPYNLTSLALLDYSGKELQFIPLAASTAAYNYTDFLPAGERITGPFRDEPVDADSNGVNEQLAINIGVTIATPRTYTMTGLLSDSEGLAIARTGNLTTLSAGDQTVTLLFDGVDIFRHAVSGRYTLSSVMLARSGEGLPDMMAGTYTTQEYDYLTFEQPPALIVQFHALPQAGPAPLSVNFFDDSTGSPSGWNWSFGDGTYSAEQHPSHTYMAIGTYDVTLHVSNSYGSNVTEKAGFIEVAAPGEPLVADFTANITRGPAPLTVRFTDTSTGSPSMWNWHFGEFDFSMEKNPVFTFVNPGSYQIMLEVFGIGYNVTIRPGYITVLAPGEVPPVALFTANVTSGTAPLTVGFTDQSTGSPSGWNWSFGDGQFSSDQNPEHVYLLPGTYPVALNATNAFGSDRNLTPDYIHVFLRGDLNRNSRVDIGDVTRVAYIAVGLLPEDLRADFDSSGHVEVGDAARIAWYYVGKIPEI